MEKIYFVDSQNCLNGEYKEYRENGSLWIHCYYQHDQLINIYNQYDTNSKLMYSYDYNNLDVLCN